MCHLSRYRFIFLAFFLFLLNHQTAFSQEKWTLSAEHNGIKVYTRHIADYKVKAVKVSAVIQSTPSQLLAAILDIHTCDQWVYHSKQNVLIKKISPVELIYYSEVAVPWPAENRDYVVHIQTEQNPATKVITVNSPCIRGYVAEKDGVVRISHSVGKWVITPMGKNQVNAEYTLEVDPMGSIPAWLTNMFAAKGPMETFKSLKVHVQKDVYKNASFKQITD